MMVKFKVKSLKLKVFFLLLIIISVAAFFRLWQLDSIPPGLYPDEAINGNDALSLSGKIFYPENNGREGLFINLISLSFAIFSPSVWALRLVPAVIGILTILGLYLLTKELFQNSKATLRGAGFADSKIQNSKRFRIWNLKNWDLFRISDLGFEISYGEKIALLSSFFLAVSFWHINFSRLGFRAILVPFILVFSFYFLLKGLRIFWASNQKTNQKSGQISGWGPNPTAKSTKIKQNYGLVRSSALNFGLAGLLFGLGFYTYTPFRLAVLILPFIFVPYWFFFRKEGLQKKFLLLTSCFLLLIFIVALPLGFYFIWHPQYFISRAAGVSVFAADSPFKALGESLIKHLGMFNFRGDSNWRHNFAGSPMLLWPIGILFLIGFFFSIKELIKKDETRSRNENGSRNVVHITHLSLVSWFFVMLLPGVLTFEGVPHALRVVGVLPVVYIFAALGGWLVFNFFERNLANLGGKKLLIFATALFLISIASLQFDKYFNKWASRPEVRGAFSENYVKMGEYLKSLPPNTQKYVIVNTPGVPVPYPKGVPMPAQTIMFIEKTKKAGTGPTAKYVLPENLKNIIIEREAVILPMREDPDLFIRLWENFPQGKLEREKGFWIYRVNAKFKMQNAKSNQSLRSL